MSVRAALFTTPDLTDTAKRPPPRVPDYARARGWWDGDERHFDFAFAYGADKSPNEVGPWSFDSMNMRRRWRAMELLSASRRTRTKRSTASDRRNPSRAGRSWTSSATCTTERNTIHKAPPSGDPFADVTPDYALCRRGTLEHCGGLYAGDRQRPLDGNRHAAHELLYMPLYVDIDGLPAFCETFLPGEGENTSLFWEFKGAVHSDAAALCQTYGDHGKAKRKWEAHAAAVLAAHSRDMAQLPESERRAARTKFDRAVLTSALETCRETRACPASAILI